MGLFIRLHAGDVPMTKGWSQTTKRPPLGFCLFETEQLRPCDYFR